MKLLLDTCTFLWIIQGSDELSVQAKQLFVEPENEIYLSVISLWETLIKCNLGCLSLPKPTSQFLTEQRQLHRIESLALEENDIIHLPQLPEYHKDPFDRMLICQAIANSLIILTPDKEIRQYPVVTIW